MEPLIKKLDFMVRHWAPFQRRFPSSLPLVTIDAIPEKNSWVSRAFDTANFSLILRGEGQLHVGPVIHPVVAPCVIIQWPGQFLHYGPTQTPSLTWDEVYLIYPASAADSLARMNLLKPDRPVWPITELAAVSQQLRELAALTRTAEPEKVVDRVDRVAERLILETCLAPDARPIGDATLLNLAAELRSQLASSHDLTRLASSCGMSPSTFRRRWATTFGQPPARYLQEIRLREACRLLAETSLPIHEISRTVGFEDEFYFSRRFHREMRMAPRDYRKTYRFQRP